MTKQSALHDNHIENGAKLVDFAGYKLPLWFSTMKDEHLAVRNSAGMFDISHMGLFKISGDKAIDFMQRLSCNDAERSLSSKMIYSMFLNESGMILDDVMFAFNQDHFHLIVNGANTEKIKNWMTKQNKEGLNIEQLNNSHSLIAVQGPEAVSALNKALNQGFDDVPAFGLKNISLSGEDCIATRTGYTGEDGFELMVPQHIANYVWSALLKQEVKPCGLAARDGLRIEFGLPLYGQELSETIHPFMTRYPWVVKFNHDFIGKDALEQAKENVTLKAVGLEIEGALIARTNYEIKEGGYVSSGTLSPVNGKSIALAFVPKELSSIGSSVTVNIRKKDLLATVVKVPFLSK